LCGFKLPQNLTLVNQSIVSQIVRHANGCGEKK
jgi:hypothetical protein